MNAAERTEQLLKDAVCGANQGDTLEIHTNAQGSGTAGWRTVALLSMAAAAMNSQDAFAGAVADGRVKVQEVTGVVYDATRVMRSGEYIERAAGRDDLLGVLRGVQAVLRRAERYEGKEQDAPLKQGTSVAAKPDGQGYSSASEFLGDFGMKD